LRERFALSVSVFVIVRSADQVLLLRRANTGWKDGFFSLPAGRHDGAETLAAAAVRELREETSLHAEEHDMELVHLLHCNSGDSGGEWLGAFFEAKKWSGEPRLVENEKHDLLDWHSIGDLPSNTIPYTRQGIEFGLKQIPFSAYGW
jgi:8-oxo-dGTP pyrophosphatase MutT (NUDIX family)